MVSEQLPVPAARVPEQLSVPSVTVALPVGVPALDVTVNATATAWPTVEGSGDSLVIVVVVAAGFTVWLTPVEVLGAKLASPAYVAVSVLAPAVVAVSEHAPWATVPTQVSAPSLTVTFPVGVPPLEVTLKVTLIAPPNVEGLGVLPVIDVVVAA
jgi:hypothetical protein